VGVMTELVRGVRPLLRLPVAPDVLHRVGFGSLARRILQHEPAAPRGAELADEQDGRLWAADRPRKQAEIDVPPGDPGQRRQPVPVEVILGHGGPARGAWSENTVDRAPSVRCGFEDDAEALALGRLDGVLTHPLPMAPLAALGSGLLVRGLPGEEMGGRHEDGTDDRVHPLLVPPVAYDASRASGEGPLGRTGVRRGRRSGQRPAQPPIPFPHRTRAVFAGALGVAEADACPAGAMPRAREDAHVGGVGEDHLCHVRIHPWIASRATSCANGAMTASISALGGAMTSSR
jgi:hypothetical protein